MRGDEGEARWRGQMRADEKTRGTRADEGGKGGTATHNDNDDNDNDDNDKGQQGGPEDHHHDSTPNCHQKQLLMGWKWGAMRMGMMTMTTTMTRDTRRT